MEMPYYLFICNFGRGEEVELYQLPLEKLTTKEKMVLFVADHCYMDDINNSDDQNKALCCIDAAISAEAKKCDFDHVFWSSRWREYRVESVNGYIVGLYHCNFN